MMFHGLRLKLERLRLYRIFIFIHVPFKSMLSGTIRLYRRRMGKLLLVKKYFKESSGMRQNL